MKRILNFTQFLNENEFASMPVQFTAQELSRVGDIEANEPDHENEYEEEEEWSDHEVGMSQNLLDDIIKNAQELKDKIGDDEKNLAGWIQDHISQAQNYINQANTGYHELTEAARVRSVKSILKEKNPKYYAVLPTMEPDMKEFVEYMKAHNIDSFLTEDDPEYGQYEYLYISNDEKKLKDFVQKYWEDDADAEEGEKFTDEIKKYSK